MNYSHVICIGDSMTNEIEHYKHEGILDKLKERGYEFKSYPQILGEKFNCPFETFGKPGMTMPFTMMKLIENIDYILSLPNPLVIYQFGVFFNSTLKVDDNLDVSWKDFGLHGTNPGHDVVIDAVHPDQNKYIQSLSPTDRLSMITWYEKFEEFRNYWYIEEFITVAKLLNRMNQTPIDVFGMFFSSVKFKIPTDYHLLNMWNIGPASIRNMEPMSGIFPDINDQHKTTWANNNIANEIIRLIKLKRMI
jgi:hypothetical protein